MRIEETDDVTFTGASAAPAEPIIVKPQLEHPALSFIRLVQKNDALDHKQAQVTEKEVKKARETIEEAEAEKAALLAKEAEEIAARNTWNTLVVVAQYIAGVAGFIVGFSIGGIAGGCLAASGAIGLASRLATDTGLLVNEDLQRVAGVLQLLLGIGGAIGAWNGAVEVVSLVSQAATIVSAAATLSGTVTQFGAKYHEKNIAELNSEMKELNADITSSQQTLSQATSHLSHAITTSQHDGEATTQMIRNLTKPIGML